MQTISFLSSVKGYDVKMSKLKSPKVKADRPKRRKVTRIVESENGGLGGIIIGLVVGVGIGVAGLYMFNLMQNNNARLKSARLRSMNNARLSHTAKTRLQAGGQTSNNDWQNWTTPQQQDRQRRHDLGLGAPQRQYTVAWA